MHQHDTFPRPKAPSTDRSLPSLVACAPTSFGAATGPPFCHGRPSFRHAFTPNVCALDPRTCRLFTGALEPHVAYRLLQTGRSTSTPPSRPNPIACYGGEPPCDGQQSSVETCRPGPLRPGVATLYVEEPPPRRRPRVAADLPQPVAPGHLLSQAHVPQAPESSCATTARKPDLVAERTRQARRTCRTTRLEGPPSTPPRESDCG